MEGVIASLLKDFEDGKMSRRQLVQSLAMMAVAGPAAAAVGGDAQAPAAKAPWKTVHLDHISYAVSDYKRSAAFYQGLMGWEIANDNGTNQATLKIGNVGEIIIRNARRPADSTAGTIHAGASRTRRSAAGDRRHQPRLLGHRAVGHRWREGGAREARAEAAAGHAGERLQELARAGSGWVGSADQQPDEIGFGRPARSQAGVARLIVVASRLYSGTTAARSPRTPAGVAHESGT